MTPHLRYLNRAETLAEIRTLSLHGPHYDEWLSDLAGTYYRTSVASYGWALNMVMALLVARPRPQTSERLGVGRHCPLLSKRDDERAHRSVFQRR